MLIGAEVKISNEKASSIVKFKLTKIYQWQTSFSIFEGVKLARQWHCERCLSSSQRDDRLQYRDMQADATVKSTFKVSSRIGKLTGRVFGQHLLEYCVSVLSEPISLSCGLVHKYIVFT